MLSDSLEAAGSSDRAQEQQVIQVNTSVTTQTTEHGAVTQKLNETALPDQHQETQRTLAVMTNSILKWSGLLFTVSGALFSSLTWTPWNIWCFNIGSALYLLWSLRIRELNLILVNGFLLLIYLFGTMKTLDFL